MGISRPLFRWKSSSEGPIEVISFHSAGLSAAVATRALAANLSPRTCT